MVDLRSGKRASERYRRVETEIEMSHRINRKFLSNRIVGSMFGEDAVLIRLGTPVKNEHGEVIESPPTETKIRVATNPASGSSSRVNILLSGGARLEDIREFHTIEEIDVERRGSDPIPPLSGERFGHRKVPRDIRVIPKLFFIETIRREFPNVSKHISSNDPLFRFERKRYPD